MYIQKYGRGEVNEKSVGGADTGEVNEGGSAREERTQLARDEVGLAGAFSDLSLSDSGFRFTLRLVNRSSTESVR